MTESHGPGAGGRCGLGGRERALPFPVVFIGTVHRIARVTSMIACEFLSAAPHDAHGFTTRAAVLLYRPEDRELYAFDDDGRRSVFSSSTLSELLPGTSFRVGAEGAPYRVEVCLNGRSVMQVLNGAYYLTCQDRRQGR